MIWEQNAVVWASRTLLFTTEHKRQDTGPCHIWVHEVEQCSPETWLHLSQPHRCLFSWDSMVCTHDWISTAFGTLHSKIKYSTCSPSPLASSNVFSLPQNKEPRHKETTVLFLAVGCELIRPRFVGVVASHVQHCRISWHNACDWLDERIIKRLNVWVMYLWP